MDGISGLDGPSVAQLLERKLVSAFFLGDLCEFTLSQQVSAR